MKTRKPPLWCVLLVGVVLGWLAGRPTARLEARDAQESDRSAFLTGPIALQNHPTVNTPVPLDALYVLDYRRGRIVASVPSYRQTGYPPNATGAVLGAFTARDLAADFRLPPGITPKFQMSVGQLGNTGVGGWAPLYVVETTTGRLAAYRVEPTGAGPKGELPPKFELLELQTLP